MPVNCLHTFSISSKQQGQTNKTLCWVSALQTECHSSPFQRDPGASYSRITVPNMHRASPQLTSFLLYIFPYRLVSVRLAPRVSLALALNPTLFMYASPCAWLSKHATGFTRAVCFRRQMGLPPPTSQKISYTFTCYHEIWTVLLGKLKANTH